jgi:alanyl-tRNA synthetase
MSTEKLYWNDPFATEFDAERVRADTFDGRASIVLERTLFYPEAGGQLADAGTLTFGAGSDARSLAVSDVQVDDSGIIHHLVAVADPSIVGAVLDAHALKGSGVIHGAIDRDRRRDHMAQHTAQHMLSRALVDVVNAETASARLGATTCTIDVGVADIHDKDLARVEDLVNAVVTSDVVVRSLFPTDEELSKLALRRAPKVSANIRIIDINGFDLTPCGGTHCTRTGQIGVVRVAGLERYKGGLRISFHAGRRAIDDARKKERVLADLAKDFTCGVLDVGGAVGKLRVDLKARLDMLSATRGELVELLAERLLTAHPPDPSGTTRIAIVRERDDIGMLRTLAGRLAARADVVAFCASPDPAAPSDASAASSTVSKETMAIVVQRGAAALFDCGKWLKAASAKHGGRGGGRPERAEGRMHVGDAAALAAIAREEMA